MKTAVFTLIYGENYLPGCLLLGKILKDHIQNQNLKDVELGLLIETTSFSEQQLWAISKVYDRLVPIEALESEMTERLHDTLKRPELAKTFSKVYLWGLLEYSKILYLDCDTLPLGLPDKANVMDLLGLEFENSKLLAAPDSGFPDIFNSGVLVLRPNRSDYGNLLDLACKSLVSDVSFDGADQGLLNQYFNSQPNWVSDLLYQNKHDVEEENHVASSNWIKLPFLYNVTSSTCYQYLPAFNYFNGEAETPVVSRSDDKGEEGSDGKLVPIDYFSTLDTYRTAALGYFNSGTSQIKIFHFIGPHKPWKKYASEGMASDWWKSWNNFFPYTSVEEAEKGRIKEFGEYIQTEDARDIVNLDPNTECSHEDTSPIDIENMPQHVLCDPHSYDNLEDSKVTTSADSLWDATKEFPPKSISNPNVQIQVEAYPNAWDLNANEGVAEATPDPSKNEDSELDISQEGIYGIHTSYKPERRFSAETDYVISHPLEKLRPASQLNKGKMFNKDKMFTKDKTFNKMFHKPLIDDNLTSVKERLSELALDKKSEEEVAAIDYKEAAIDNKHVDEIIREIGFSEEIPKLFPWEFRSNNIGPERTFEKEY